MAVMDLHHEVVDAYHRSHSQPNIRRHVDPGGVQSPCKDDLRGVSKAAEQGCGLAIPVCVCVLCMCRNGWRE